MSAPVKIGGSATHDPPFHSTLGGPLANLPCVLLGREQFARRHAEVFAGFLKGTSIAMTMRKLRFVRLDVAIVDLDVGYTGFQAWPPGVQPTPDSGLHASLLMVLVNDGGDWWIAAYHNIWRTHSERAG
jgi:uncharacterized protein (TIGR02246 family)